MGEIALRTLAYAALCAASTVTVLATLVVLTSSRGRLNGTAFLAAFLLAQTGICIAGLFASGTAVEKLEGHAHTGASIFKLALGVALLVAAAVEHKRTATRESAASPRTEAVVARLERIRPATALTAGLALGIGTKRLILTLVAVTTISVAELSSGDEASLIVLFVAVASLSVWLAVALYLVLGDHARKSMDAAKRWLTANSATVTFYVTLVTGAFLCIDGLIELL